MTANHIRPNTPGSIAMGSQDPPSPEAGGDAAFLRNGKANDSWLLFLVRILQAFRREWIAISLFSLGSSIIAAIIVLLLPQYYRATSTLLVPAPSEGSGLGALSALAGKDLGSLIQGKMGSNSSISTLETLLKSRSLGEAAIAKFRLDTVWEFSPGKIKRENLLKQWAATFAFEITLEDALVLTFEDRDPKRAAAVVAFVSSWVDSAFQANQRLQAQRTSAFIETRLKERKKLLSDAEDSLVSFQLRHNAFVPSEQLKQSIMAAASLESQIQELEVKIRTLQAMTGSGSSEVRAMQSMQAQLRTQLAQMTRSQGKGRDGGVFKKLGSGLLEELQFERLSRQVIAQGHVYQFLVQQSEQLGIEKLKNIPVLSIVDPAVPPQKRSRPPRQLAVQAVFLIAFLLSCGWAITKHALADRLSSSEKEALRSLVRLRRAPPAS